MMKLQVQDKIDNFYQVQELNKRIKTVHVDFYRYLNIINNICKNQFSFIK